MEARPKGKRTRQDAETRELLEALNRFRVRFRGETRAAAQEERGQLWSWWRGRSLEERRRVLCIQDAGVVALLSQLAHATERKGGARLLGRTVKFTIFREEAMQLLSRW